MAGKAKHMERSHRSYGNNDSAFRSFNARASKLFEIKQQKKSGNPFAKAVEKVSKKIRRNKGDK